MEREIDITVEEEREEPSPSQDEEFPRTCESDTYLDQLQRLQAEFENYRKRIQRREEQLTDEVRGEMCKQLLPVMDDMERALAHSREDPSTIRSGLELVYGNLISLLTGIGLKAIETSGRPFDPQVHEAVMVVVDPAGRDEIVTEEFQKGYFFKDRLLRPARVKVSQGSE